MADTHKNDRAAWIHGPSACCESAPELAASSWRLILLGAPGVGKGTQADLLISRPAMFSVPPASGMTVTLVPR